MVTYCWTYRSEALIDGRKPEKILKSLHLAIARQLSQEFGFKRDDSASTVPALFSASDTAACDRLGMRCVEMAAAAVRTANAKLLLLGRSLGHDLLLFCSSAKLTRSLRFWLTGSIPSRATPCIEAATAAPTKQSSQ